jgi:biopolymer transport protein ExbD
MEDDEIELVPIMNMFLVLIPFLLLSASFFHIKAINTSVPVMASTDSRPSTAPHKSSAKVTVIVEFKESALLVSAMSSDLTYNELSKLETELPVKPQKEYPLGDLADHLRYIKDMYPKSDTLILVPDTTVVYGTLIETMDAARSKNSQELFPNVVLSEKIG